MWATQRSYFLKRRGHSCIKSKLMTVGSFVCDKMAIWLHKMTCKYSFMILTWQVEDDIFIFWGLNYSHYGFELDQTPKPYAFPNVPRCFLPNVLCLHVWPHTDKIFQLLHFKSEKGISGPLKPKGPELGVDITNLRWPSVSVIRKY